MSTQWMWWTYELDRLLDGIRFMYISMDYRKHSFGIRAKSPAGNWMRCCGRNIHWHACCCMRLDGRATSYRLSGCFTVLVGNERIILGGQATRVLVGAVIPGFAHMKNSFSESSHLLTNDFIGMVLWYLIFLPLLLISPERLQIPFGISFVLFSSTCIGILSWAVRNAGGPGSMFHHPATTNSVGWGVMFGITAILGAWGASSLSQSDWTRYANRPLAPTLSQLVAAPITVTITAIIGIIVTSAANDILGEVIWSPIQLLATIQEHYSSSPRSRAGVFFASIGTVSTQLAISLVLNSVSAGMDLAGLQPKYINIRRGSYIMVVLGLASQPWQLLASADKFLTVLSGFGIFMAPLIGIMLSDYLVIRRQTLKLCDLYKGDSSSIYWYWHGFNWRGAVAFTASIWSQIPGLVASVNKDKSPAMQGWIKLFNITFFVGLAMGFTWMTVLSYLFPPPGLGVEAPFVEGCHPKSQTDSSPRS
ncbi:hypothetical protein TEQG_06234 [Trichophyton equinum CBS 127.97]|uniref:Uracil permease n=1 Tax=Trichophyton equinum (strain ATCC MYA-4606 / CBS 127.97) TaxID=559882 RepID=F2PZK8_TRIEC|nr:hypothetical protein TEQG_06234 [Trichophyton equinum CBS 127.97]